MSGMISRAMGALLKSGSEATTLCRRLRDLVTRMPVEKVRIEDFTISDRFSSQLPVFKWSISFRSKEELEEFDNTIRAIVNIDVEGESE